MSIVIRVDEDVYEELDRQAQPGEERPNAVIRRLLGMPPGEPVQSHRRFGKSSTEA
jgi:predicted CopG family antitoxin